MMLLVLRLKKRIPAGLEFEYSYDFDDKGIIYYIATNGGREPYTNPHTAARVRVTASSVERWNMMEEERKRRKKRKTHWVVFCRGDVERLVARDPQELWTKDVPASWFTIDLGRSRTVRLHRTARLPLLLLMFFLSRYFQHTTAYGMAQIGKLTVYVRSYGIRSS